MYRRISVIAVLCAATAVAVWAAAERATFVLTNGERKSGAVVYHGDKAENLINGFLNLSNDAGGPEFTIPMDQVIVIDFAGGRPTAAEKNAVATDSSHLLVLRNGETRKGRFGNMIGGDTLVWQREGGRGEERHGIRDVTRVYLNSRLAWTSFIGEDPPTRAAGSAPATGTTVKREPGTIEVPGKQGWTDTGITVRRGEVLVFHPTGNVNLREDSPAGPDGRPGFRSKLYPVAAALGGTLIARVGNNRPFVIGSISEGFPMLANGRLMLGINDDAFDDNSGSFVVKIAKQ